MARVELILPPRMATNRTVLVPIKLQMHRTESSGSDLGLVIRRLSIFDEDGQRLVISINLSLH